MIAAIALGAFYLIAPDKFKEIFGLNDATGTGDASELLNVHFVDVGQGDCIIIELPDGKNMIMDAGSSSYSDVKFQTELRPYIDSLEITVFDYMILTHTDTDHVGYMDEVLKYYTVRNIYRPAFISNSEDGTKYDNGKYKVVTTGVYDSFINACINEVEQEGAKMYNNIGTRIISGDGYSLTMYGVDEEEYECTDGNRRPNITAYDINYVSPISVLEFYGRVIVLTGDAEGKGGNGREEDFLKNAPIIDCDILKAGHHGSESSSNDAFLSAIDPEYVVVSVGEGNKHGHPNKSFLDRISAYQDKKGGRIDGLYRTDEYGDITLKISGDGNMSWDFEKSAAA